MKRNISTFLFYILGGICWFILFGVLKKSCILDIPKHIDNLWIKPIGKDLVENLIGAIAYRVEGYECDDKLIFIAQYYDNNIDEQSEMRSLSTLVHIPSWKKNESDTISTTYSDDYYKYILFQTSDGVYMKVFKK